MLDKNVKHGVDRDNKAVRECCESLVNYLNKSGIDEAPLRGV